MGELRLRARTAGAAAGFHLTQMAASQPHVAIACGGTGGHFFPGVAVARALQQQNVRVTLWVSNKAIDQKAVATVPDLAHVRTPAVALEWRRPWRFLFGLRTAMRQVRTAMADDRPEAVLAMGGFTSAAPVWVGRKLGAATFLHESNAVPGRANRLLSRWADEVLVGMAPAAERFGNSHVEVTGTPVRDDFRGLDQRPSREALGLPPDQPMVLVIGGSQGARGVNRLVTAASTEWRGVSLLHVCGATDEAEVRAAYAGAANKVQVHAFLKDMPQALGAATLAVSRAGASSIAELAAARVPAVFIPLPNSADDHQRANAAVVVAAGGGKVLEQHVTSSGELARVVEELLQDDPARTKMVEGMAALDRPESATQIADRILRRL